MVFNLRTATVITEENTHFGTVNKDDYDYCLKQVTDKQNKTYINLILNHKMFESMPYGVFKKKYFNMFVHLGTSINESIFKENNPADNVYFIRLGEFELSMKKSFNEINQLIKHFGGEPKYVKLDIINEEDKHRINRFFNEKKLTKVSK